MDDPDVRTMADLLAELGGVCPERVLIEPPPGMATEADVSRFLGSLRKRICELIDGTLVEKAPGFCESVLAAGLIVWLREASRGGSLGLTLGPTAGSRLSPIRIRFPDVSFIAWDRLPGRRIPNEEFPALCPNYVFEFYRQSNTALESERKRTDFFSAGTEEYWEIDAAQRSIAFTCRIGKALSIQSTT